MASLSRLKVTPLRLAEYAASCLGVAGMGLGSTTLYGALCYAVGIPVLVWCVVYKRKAYGLLPLNVAQLAVAFFNVWRALS